MLKAEGGIVRLKFGGVAEEEEVEEEEEKPDTLRVLISTTPVET